METAADVRSTDIPPNNNAGPSTSPLRRSPSTCSIASTSSNIDEHTDMSSSEDEAEGVFFGGHDTREEQLVAQLSKSIPSTPEPQHRRMSRPRIKKRDSREFLRRKTLLLTARTNTPVKQDKVWEGGFYEKGPLRETDMEQDSDEEFQTPNLHRIHMEQSPMCVPAEHCDITIDFSKFHLSDSPSMRPEAEVAAVEDEASTTDEELGGSDKENEAGAASPIIRRDGATQVLAPIAVVVGLENEVDSDAEGGSCMRERS